MTTENKNIVSAEDLGLSVSSFDSFLAGETEGSKFTLPEGSYAAVCRGYVIKNHEFDGQNFGPKIQLIWQVEDEDGNIHTLLSNRWKISADERSKFRADIAKWFNKTDWSAICDLLIKMGVLKKDESTGVGTFDITQFIGKRANLLVSLKKSKKGKEFNEIMSISPAAKKVTAIAIDDIPEYITKDALDYKLFEGVGIRSAKSDKEDIADTSKANTESTDIVDDEDLPF